MTSRIPRYSIVFSLSLAVVCAAARPTFAQPERSRASDPVFELVLKDGSRMFGTVTSETEDTITFRTSAGAVVTAKRTEVSALRKVDGRVQAGEFFPSDTHKTRLLFAPTARSLRKGQVSLGIFEISAPFLQVGITDRFSFGGGTPLLIGFDESTRPFWVTPKYQVWAGETAQAAVGAMHLFGPGGGGAGIAYGVGTFGSSDNALTIGAGFAYADDTRGAVVMVGGEARTRPHLKVITENYIWKNGDGILSAGVRFLGERLSADLALAVPIGLDYVVAFPVVNFVYVF